MSNPTALQQLRARIAALDTFAEQGGRGSGLYVAEISKEHVQAFKDRVLDIIDESGVDSQPPSQTSNQCLCEGCDGTGGPDKNCAGCGGTGRRCPGPRKPDGYAYRRRSPFNPGETFIDFDGPRDKNGSAPVEAIPYWLGSPPETTAPLDYKLPCEVRLPPSMSIGKGCPLSTLMHAFRVREGTNAEFVDERAMAVRRALTELHRPQEGVTVSNETEHATYVETDDGPCTTCNDSGWDCELQKPCDCDAGDLHRESSEKSNEKLSAPAATPPLASLEPASSTDSAAGAESMSISKPPQHIPGALRCEKHGVTLAFDGDECWSCKEEANAPINS